MIIGEAIPDDAPPLHPDVLVLQGLPGAGKSTWWQEYFQSAVVLSADSFFIENGKYRFDRNKLGKAHDWCMAEFLKALQDPERKDRTIIVDNNNLSVAEVAPFMRLPQCFNRHALLLTFHCPVEVCIRRQNKKIPVPAMMKKARTFNLESSRMPLWWHREYIFSAVNGMSEDSWTPSREQL